ncbi:glycerate kinase [Phycicoccus badiiscoriae]|uniref:Glycerate kinase n=1 Tax=Pedococcus badiiscoriae TaxID=642776 RepID=A0A852WGH3_9MICO|nr:glycerate kinase [Pedococcus badiiscoriae]NYG06621.1 glycerate kinase [Pedococcus badiiscoriae]
MPRVLLAPDKFKGTLTADEVAGHLSNGLRSVMPDVEVVVVPVADGGDGTLDAAVAAGFTRVPVRATGPTGVPCAASYARRGTDAVVELAQVSGLAQLPGGRSDALGATSRGTGEVIAAALDAGARRIVVGIGGSACTDGGAGLLGGLGARLSGRHGRALRDGGGALEDVVSLDLSELHPALAEAELVVACDVDNPLTGRTGAAAVYGPQKGAGPEDVERLDAALSRWAAVVAAATGHDHRDRPGAGAAGGVGFALMAVLGAVPRPGAQVVAELTGLADAVGAADLVVTGEGSLDAQTLHGKAPAAVAALARDKGVAAVAVAGQVTLTHGELAAAGLCAAYALVDEAGTRQEALDAPGPLLERLGARIAREHLCGVR